MSAEEGAVGSALGIRFGTRITDMDLNYSIGWNTVDENEVKTSGQARFEEVLPVTLV